MLPNSHRMRCNLTTIRPAGFIHSSGFAEVIDSLAWALCALGHEANVTENWLSNSETNIVFGAELLSAAQTLPKNTIIYNLEQPSHPNLEKVRELAKGLTVWDYSATNVRDWQARGYQVRHVPIGYTPNLTRIPKADVQDIDVLFYGFLTPRRTKIIEELKAAGLKVVATENCYGGGRDNLISRAKVVLNIHHDGRSLFEIVRVSYLLANGKCVVSECSEDDADYGDLKGIWRLGNVPIAEVCREIIGWDVNRKGWEAVGLRNIRARDYVATVRSALAEPTPQEKVALRFAQGRAAGDMAAFMDWIREHAKGTCLEIGTRDGASTSALLSGVEQHGGVVMSCDIDDCSHLFAGHPQWKFLRTSSQNKALRVPPLDLLFVDGDHERSAYRADLERFYPLVKPGGLILTHDIHPEPGHEFYMVGLREEFFDFAKKNSLEHYELPGYAGLGVMVKAPLIESDESWEASAALLSK